MNLFLFVRFISLLTLAHARNDGYLRKLQGREAKCSSLIAQNTTYNAVDTVPAYEGIMFEVFSKGDPLEILTLEIDVRLDNTSDLSITQGQVRTRHGRRISMDTACANDSCSST
jgi:hypothetical protein